jgi:hypothetical protein
MFFKKNNVSSVSRNSRHHYGSKTKQDNVSLCSKNPIFKPFQQQKTQNQTP